MWGTSADADVTWGSASEDALLYPDDEALQPLPSVELEFGDAILLAPIVSTAPTDGTTTSGTTASGTTTVVTVSSIGGGF